MKNELTVNGSAVTFRDDQRNELLIDFLHEQGLTGTKLGCGIGACGACKVAVQEREGGELIPVLACYARVDAVEGLRVTTVEGLATPGGLHPLQQRFLDTCAFQCGYSTPGMLMAARILIDRLIQRGGVQRRFLDREISAAISGHVCRCTGYVRYAAAIRDVVEAWSPRLVLDDPKGGEPLPERQVTPAVWFRVRKRSRNDTREKVLEGRFERPESELKLARPMAWETAHGRMTVRLASLKTGEPARDLNVRRYLFGGVDEIHFEVGGAKVIDRQVPGDALPPGYSLTLRVEGELRIDKARVPLQAEVTATADADCRLLVRTRQPIRVPLKDLRRPVETFARAFGLSLGDDLELGLDDVAITYPGP